MSEEELQKLLEDEVAKGNAVLFNEKNMRKLLENKSEEELDSMISDLMKFYSVNDDVMRIEAIEIILKIIKEKYPESKWNKKVIIKK